MAGKKRVLNMEHIKEILETHRQEISVDSKIAPFGDGVMWTNLSSKIPNLTAKTLYSYVVNDR